MHFLADRKKLSFQLLLVVFALFVGCGAALAAQDQKKPAVPAKIPVPKKPATVKTPPAGGQHQPQNQTNSGKTTGSKTTGSTGGTKGPIGPTTAKPRPTPERPHTSDQQRKDVHSPNPRRGETLTQTKSGNWVTKRANGRPADLHDNRRNMDIHHGLAGGRRIEARRGDLRVVAMGRRRGFVEEPYRFRNREYLHRTYYFRGRAYDRFYYGYAYRGVYVRMYTPAYFYAPGFYGWASYPWGPPVPYAWGWVGTPWYGYYGFYFTPYPVYPSAYVWLTDYTISANLSEAYEARAEDDGQVQAQAQTDDAAALTPQVKALIAVEVQRQINIENAESKAKNDDPNPAVSGIGATLNDNLSHVFIVDDNIDVTDASGAECALSEGDVLQLKDPPPEASTSATLVVLSNKSKQECRAGNNVVVDAGALQDMQNHMRETIDQGMAELQTKQGTGGLPALPASAKVAPTQAAFATGAPGPDANAGTEITAESQEADRSEPEVLAEAQASGPGPSAPPDDNPAPGSQQFDPMGKTPDEVIGQFGQPSRKLINLPGGRQIFVYTNPNVKITFKDGKVIDVE